jgi:hypothetical protein
MRYIFTFFFLLFAVPVTAQPSKAAFCLSSQAQIVSLVKGDSTNFLSALIESHNKACGAKLELSELELMAAENLVERDEQRLKALKALVKSKPKPKPEPKVESKPEPPKPKPKAKVYSCKYRKAASISANNSEIERLKSLAKELHKAGKNPIPCVASLNVAITHQAELIFNLVTESGSMTRKR